MQPFERMMRKEYGAPLGGPGGVGGPSDVGGLGARVTWAGYEARVTRGHGRGTPPDARARHSLLT